MSTVFVYGRTRWTALMASSSTALCAARLTATWKSRSMARMSSIAAGGGSSASTAARMDARSSSSRTSAARRTQPSSIHARASSTSPRLVLPVWDQSASVSASVVASTSGSGWRTKVPPVAPRAGCTSCAAARIFMVSRTVPRLTPYSSARSTSLGRRCPAARSPLRMLSRIWSAICCAALVVRMGRGSNPAAGLGSATHPSYGRSVVPTAGRVDLDRTRKCWAFRSDWVPSVSSPTLRGDRVSTSSPASGALPPLDISYEDDPKVVEQAATEDYSLHIVPRTWRIDRLQLTMAWWAVMTAFFYLYFASFLALAYGTVNAL